MTIKVKDTNINYTQYGNGEDIILLHGWGQNIEMMLPLAKRIEKDKRITIIDFPGFGKSDEPNEIWTIYDYCEMLHELIEKLQINNPVLIGHSFGGRVAICYSSKYNTKKVVLFGAPCVRDRKPNIKEKMFKALKKVPGTSRLAEAAKKYIGSTDYKNTTPLMRNILVNVINEDLSECAKKISAPTLLIWGTCDTQAPLEDAKKLENLLSDGALIELEGYTHYAYLEDINHVSNILKEFL